jgi:DNA-binding CsgD family transcriptional regulator
VTAGDLERGREAYERRVWANAHELLSSADQAAPLGADDLELLATSAYMLGHEDEYVAVLERAHHAHLEAGATSRAVRCAFWVGLTFALRGATGPASGWLGRAQRLLDHDESDSVERGYLLMPRAFQHEAAGDLAAAAAVAAEAAAIAERFRDVDGFTLAILTQGHMLLKDGRVQEGLALLDEAMVAVTSGALSPMVTGIVYCTVILACQEVHEVRRAREWTAALTRWCEGQPDLVAFTGRCLLHRAEILQLNGSWPDALEAARHAGRRFRETMNPAAGIAQYRAGEVLRLQGDFAAAEAAYRDASRAGREPQPGLAQLRLAQGRHETAATSIRRARAETTEPLKLAEVLPALVEIMLAVGDVEEARAGCDRLEEIAAEYESPLLSAIVAHARGAVALADGDGAGALVALRRALQLWQDVEAPYDLARARMLIGEACRLLGDDDSAALEFEAAREAFRRLGAAPDFARVAALVAAADEETFGLTRRELEILRLVAAGKSNREIAAALVISEHTVARHLQNIFAKLDVSSRTAASAFAYEHDLV